FAGPQVERHRQLIGHSLNDQLANPHGLTMGQVSAARSAASLARAQRPQATFPRRLHLPAYRTQAHAVRSRGIDLCHPAAHLLHHHLSQVRLRRLVQLSGIGFQFHTRITHHALFGAPVSNNPAERLSEHEAERNRTSFRLTRIDLLHSLLSIRNCHAFRSHSRFKWSRSGHAIPTLSVVFVATPVAVHNHHPVDSLQHAGAIRTGNERAISSFCAALCEPFGVGKRAHASFGIIEHKPIELARATFDDRFGLRNRFGPVVATGVSHLGVTECPVKQI
ncbi:hypothetical protein, partial [Burkholderia ubonensis]